MVPDFVPPHVSQTVQALLHVDPKQRLTSLEALEASEWFRTLLTISGGEIDAFSSHLPLSSLGCLVVCFVVCLFLSSFTFYFSFHFPFLFPFFFPPFFSLLFLRHNGHEPAGDQGES